MKLTLIHKLLLIALAGGLLLWAIPRLVGDGGGETGEIPTERP